MCHSLLSDSFFSIWEESPRHFAPTQVVTRDGTVATGRARGLSECPSSPKLHQACPTMLALVINVVPITPWCCMLPDQGESCPCRMHSVGLLTMVSPAASCMQGGCCCLPQPLCKCSSTGRGPRWASALGAYCSHATWWEAPVAWGTQVAAPQMMGWRLGCARANDWGRCCKERLCSSPNCPFA